MDNNTTNPYRQAPNVHKTAVEENIALKNQMNDMAMQNAQQQDALDQHKVALAQVADQRDQLASIAMDPNQDANMGPINQQPQDQAQTQDAVMELAKVLADGTVQPKDAYDHFIQNGASEQEAGDLVNSALTILQQADQQQTPLPADTPANDPAAVPAQPQQ